MTEGNPRFVWYELMTSDVDAARAFYGDVVGWSAKDAGVPGTDYSLFSMGESDVAGLMAIPDEAAADGARPGWLGYVGVASADEMAGRFKAAGGAVHREPTDIPGVGRFAICADPQGTMIALFQPGAGGEGPPATLDKLGFVGWNELWAVNGEEAFAFYADMFGWAKVEDMDMGEMGIYRLYGNGEITLGGMMTKTKEMPSSTWLFYFNVPDIHEGKARVEKAGGQVIAGPMEVPGGGKIIHGIDPQGAMFALYSPPKAA